MQFDHVLRQRRSVRNTLVGAIADHALANGISLYSAIAEVGEGLFDVIVHIYIYVFAEREDRTDRRRSWWDWECCWEGDADP